MTTAPSTAATPTDAEREIAHRVWNEALCNSGIPGWKRDEVFAQALAEQRDRHEAVAALRVAQALADQRARYEAEISDMREKIRQLDRFRRMVADLDRNENGRHEGDADVGDPTGTSQGNPRLGRKMREAVR